MKVNFGELEEYIREGFIRRMRNKLAGFPSGSSPVSSVVNLVVHIWK